MFSLAQRRIDLPQSLWFDRPFQMQVKLGQLHSCNNNGVTNAEAQAIAQGRHRDAFSILGPHENAVRAWLPQARKAFASDSGRAYPDGRRRHYRPLHRAADMPPGDYRIRVELYSGELQEIDDPYRFPPLLTPFELYLYGEGTNYESYRTLGAHAATCEGVEGVRFAVWAPNAEVVSVTGDFNDWDRTRHPMRLRDGGIWEIFIPGIGAGDALQIFRARAYRRHQQDKCDPYGFFAEVPPKTASIVWPLTNYAWGDGEWMEDRAHRNVLREAVSIYEVHLESWLRGPHNEWLSYRELADKLVEYALAHGLHASGAAARHGASVLRVVGLSGDRLLRAHLALRHAGRLPLLRRSLPSGRAGRDSRLGARPLPARSARLGAFRRHGALRARRSAPGRASRMGHGDFQLRPQ